MRITGDWLTSGPTRRVFDLLTGAGYQALAVGGCVRNALLGQPVADIDIATDARPNQVMAMATNAGVKAVPTGLDHGTVTLVQDGIPHEITTFRRDVATDGRHARVAFSDNPAEDARRRDFTMNALYARADGTLVDPLGGLPDVKAGRIRFIGNARDRITEDYLRILRFFRFTAWYGAPALGLDPDGLAACARHQDGLDRLSPERIGHEIRKLLSAADPAPAVCAMAQTGILSRILPGAEASILAPLIHLEDGRPPDWLRRLAALGGDPDRLRLTRSEARLLTQLRDSRGRPFALGHALGTRAEDSLLIQAASLGRPSDPAAIAEARAGAAARFPLAASDLMPTLSGPALGDALTRAQRAWTDSAGTLTREDLRALALDGTP